MNFLKVGSKMLLSVLLASASRLPSNKCNIWTLLQTYRTEPLIHNFVDVQSQLCSMIQEI